MNNFSWIFLLALGASVILKLWLAQRQMRNVAANRARVPDAFADNIQLDAHQKAADYTLANTRQGRLELVYGSVLLVAWTLGGGLQWLDSSWQQLGWSAIPTGVSMLISAFLIMACIFR
jgi:STE24 endopeptidase